MKQSLQIAVMLFSCATGVGAAEHKLSGAQIEAFLPTIAARGENSYQTFEADGRTDYLVGGRASEGRWAVQENKYCSVWPPSDIWACFTVVIDKTENLIFWVEASGAREKNRYEPRS